MPVSAICMLLDNRENNRIVQFGLLLAWKAEFANLDISISIESIDPSFRLRNLELLRNFILTFGAKFGLKYLKILFNYGCHSERCGANQPFDFLDVVAKSGKKFSQFSTSLHLGMFHPASFKCSGHSIWQLFKYSIHYLLQYKGITQDNSTKSLLEYTGEKTVKIFWQ